LLICGLLCPIWWRPGDADRRAAPLFGETRPLGLRGAWRFRRCHLWLDQLRAADAGLGAFGIGWRASDRVFVVFQVNVAEHAYRKSINVASIA
jgi:hypothetical protein